MLGFANRRPPPPEGSRLIAIKRGSELLAEHRARVDVIRSMIGVPEQHWRLLYQPLFAAYAEYAQGLPESATLENLKMGSLLQSALELVDLALKVRRGYVLPPGKEPEVVANEQDVWTYAVATAALLHGVSKILSELRVYLYGRDRVPLGVWNPWAGSLTQTGSVYYRTDRRHCAESRLPEAVTPLLAAYIVPNVGLRWLGNHDDALVAWLHAISGHAVGVSVVAKIVRQASDQAARTDSADIRVPAPDDGATDKQSNGATAETRISTAEADESPLMQTQPIQVGGMDDSDGLSIEPADLPTLPTADAACNDPGDAFVEWLAEGLTSGALPINSAKASVHVADSGLLLVSPAVFRAFAGENWRHVQKRFLKRKLTEKTADGENIFHYLLDSERGQRTIKGLLMGDAEEKLGVSLPQGNPRLSPKPAGR